MTKQVVQSVYTPRPLSMDFHARSERFAVIVAHRRFGKTIMCINDIVDKAVQNPLPFPLYSYVAPLYKQAKRIAWTYLKHYAGPLIEKTMESELSVKLKSGALISLYGADNPDSLRGVYNDGVVLDEYGNMSPRLFGEVIAPTLLDRRGWAAFIGTPAGPNHFKELWDSTQTDARWFKKMYKATETGIFTSDELEEIRTMPGSDENSYRQEMLCDFAAAVRGAYYGQLINDLEARGNFLGHYPYDPDRLVLTAWDIGYSDDTSIWFFQTDGKKIRVIDFFTVSGYEVDDVLGVLRQRPYAYGTAYLPHDAKNKSFQTGKSTRELMIKAGMVTQIVPDLSVQDGIQATRKTLHDIQFNTHNPEVMVGLNALRIYQREWDDKRRMFKESPKHDWSSNPADAMRMLSLAMTTSAAKRGSKTIQSTLPKLGSNVYNLDTLWAERDAYRKDSRRI